MTERHLEILDAVAKHGSSQRAAVALGMHRRTVERHVADAKLRAEMGVAAVPKPEPRIHTSTSVAKRILVVPDVHVPYHHGPSWDLTVRAARALKPDLLVLIGDFLDFYAVSQFSKDPKRRQNLKWEIDCGNEELDKLDDVAPEKLLTVGNHEFRLERYIYQRAPELDGMISLERELRAKERGIQWVPYKDFVRVGKVAFTHEIGHWGKHAASNSLSSFGGNLVFGHTHRAGVIYGGTVDGDRHLCMNVGWLGDPGQVDYMHRSQMRDWQHGFGWIDQDCDGNSWAQFCPIVGGRVVVQGRVFE